MNARRHQLLIALLLALGLGCAAEVFGAEIRGFLGSRPITHIEAALRGDVPHGCEGEAPSGEAHSGGELAPGAEVIPQVMAAESECIQPTDAIVPVPMPTPSERGDGALRWIQAELPMQRPPSDSSGVQLDLRGSKLRKIVIDSTVVVADNRISREVLRDLLDEVRRRRARFKEQVLRGAHPMEGARNPALPRAPRSHVPALHVRIQAPSIDTAEAQKACGSDCLAHG